MLAVRGDIIFVKIIEITLLICVSLMPQMFEIGNLNERCKEVVQFLTKNLDQFVREYNKMYEDMGEELNIEYLENYIPTFILDEQVDGVYVDFNDDRI